MRNLSWAERSLTAFLGTLSLLVRGTSCPAATRGHTEEAGWEECQPGILPPDGFLLGF